MAVAAKKGTPVSVRFGKDEGAFFRAIRAEARATRRSMSEQIKYLAFVGKVAKDNPDLPLSMIEGILEAREQIRAGFGQPYQWGVIEKE
jgi:hypothetical protein